MLYRVPTRDVEVTKVSRFRKTTLVLVLAAAGCQDRGAAPTTPAPPPPPPPNQAPQAVGMIEPVRLAIDAGPVTVALVDHFSDPDGDTLTYEATSEEESVATVAVADGEVSITPAGRGETTITVIAKDPDGLSATQEFTAAILEAGQIIYFETEEAEFDLSGDLDDFIEALPPDLQQSESVTDFAQLLGDLSTAAARLSAGVLACDAFDTYAGAIRDGAEAVTAFAAAAEGSLFDILGYLLDVIPVDGGDPDWSRFDRDGFARALTEFNGAIRAILAYFQGIETQVGNRECALFASEAPVLWSGEERLLSVVFGDETEEGLVIPVWGTPEAGNPRATVDESQWWLEKTATTFGADAGADAAATALSFAPWRRMLNPAPPYQ